MIHEQDGISYKIEGGILKGWRGESPFQKPFWDGSEIVESWTQADTDTADAEKVKQDKIKDYYNSASTIKVCTTPDGTKHYAIVIDNNGKLITIEII